MVVTHFRARDDASEKEMEALALLMGHSVKMQRDTYDRRTQQQKVEPAVEVEVSGGGSGVGIAALSKGAVDIANASRKMPTARWRLPAWRKSPARSPAAR